jgi:hypothetical protein
MCWGSTPYNGGPDGTVGRLIASSAAIVSISGSISWIMVIVRELRWPQGDPVLGWLIRYLTVQTIHQMPS